MVLVDERSKEYPYFESENDNNAYSDPNELGKRRYPLRLQLTKSMLMIISQLKDI